MPELPEVQTTVNGINAYAKNLAIKDVWTDYKSAHHSGKDNIKDPAFFAHFKKLAIGAKITESTRRAKNVLIHLSNGYTVIVHMKMTGHVLYGEYEKIFDKEKKREKWQAKGPGPLQDDPYNGHIRLVFTLSNKKHLVLSDLRRFAKVSIAKTDALHVSEHLSESGPEPLEDSFDFAAFKERLSRRPNAPIKQVLMDHTVISGIGNIYSDEILWRSNVHPLSKTKSIPSAEISLMFKAMKETLQKGIDFGGDSMSDYRNLLGESGKFQEKHNAYRKTGEKCSKPKCKGTIGRLKVGGRSAHFCDVHQKLYK